MFPRVSPPRSWSLKFDKPIALAKGEALCSLRDAATHIVALPKATQGLLAWHLAAEMLLNAAERGGMVMLTEIAMRRALQEPAPEPKTDPWIYRIVVGALGLTIIIAVVGAVLLAWIGKGSDIPQVLTALGSAAVGALAGLLAPFPHGKNETR